MAKKIKTIVKIQLPAGKATPAPPVGPVLAQHGINISDFCQKFNDKTRDMEGFKIPAEISVYEDRSYDFVLKQPTAAELLKKAANIEKGSGVPNKKKAATISREKLKEIAEKKMPDLSAGNVEAAMKIIEGTAKNMGIEVK